MKLINLCCANGRRKTAGKTSAVKWKQQNEQMNASNVTQHSTAQHNITQQHTYKYIQQIKYHKHPITEIVLKLTQIIQLEYALNVAVSLARSNDCVTWSIFRCSLPFTSGTNVSMDTKQQQILQFGCAPLSNRCFLFGIHFVSCFTVLSVCMCICAAAATTAAAARHQVTLVLFSLLLHCYFMVRSLGFCFGVQQQQQ